MFDVLIRGGLVVDGSGAAAFRADVGVADGRIVAVGPLPGACGGREIDASAHLVLPGFIDAHVHADAAVLDPEVQLALLRQGVTTVVLGQDGVSFAPAGPRTLTQVTRYFAAVNGEHPGLGDRASVAELLATYHRRVPVNTVYLVPHGTVRYEVMGPDLGRPDPAQLGAMRDLVERGLAEGAGGLSSGLEYVPGSAADSDELAYLSAPVAAAGLPYVTHMRGYEDQAAAGMREVIEVARSGVRVHVSHYHGPARELAALVDDAVASGADVSFDSYPYLRGSTILSKVLPPWLHTADLDATLAALADPSQFGRVERAWSQLGDQLWPRIVLSHLPSDEWRWAEGLPLPDAAERAGLTPAGFCARVLVDTDLAAGCVFGQPPTNSDESMRALLRHPAQLAGSDGIYQGSRPHPRGWGAFARLLARHVRELGDWTWEEAAVHLAARAAERFRLPGRGLVASGHAADLVLLDPDRIADRATYADPRRLADGVHTVLVGGVPVLADGALTAAARRDPPGTVLAA